MCDQDELVFAADKHDASYYAREFIEKWFGPRCEEHDDDCPICQRWKAYDQLFEAAAIANPVRLDCRACGKTVVFFDGNSIEGWNFNRNGGLYWECPDCGCR